MKRSAIVTLLILICLGLVSCDGSGPTNTSGYPSSVLFVETWETYPVGDFPGGGWRNGSTPYYVKKVDIPNNHKMLLDGPSEDSYGISGIYYEFKVGTMKPTYISYKVHPYPRFLDPADSPHPNIMIGNFRLLGLKGDNPKQRVGVDVYFNHDYAGYGYINSRDVSFPDYPSDLIMINNSFQIELRNIQWESTPHTYDFWVNGTEIEACVPFNESIESITTLILFNHDYGRVHFDNIYMADLPLEYNCPVVSENPPGPDIMPLPPMPSPTKPTDPVLFIIELPAFCRRGPSVEYLKISTYPEGTQLEITGQNIEGSWWWNQDGDCWVADTVGDLVGDKTTLDIIIPPPPEDTDSPDGSPGKPAECKKSLGQGACIEEGGTWDDQPGQSGTCICP